MAEEVHAAGGVVVRDGLVCLVHRPRYDDWTLPKGKLDPGEGFEEAALREVREETGLTCELGAELPSANYIDPDGRPKVVRYWQMTPVSGDFEENDEVDELRWLAPDEAREMLTHDRDRQVLAAVELDP